MSFPNQPPYWDLLGFGTYGAIPSGKAAFCYGPRRAGMPSWPLQDTDRWIFWVEASSVRFSKWTPGFVLGPSAGEDTGLVSTPTASWKNLTACFDQNASPVVAFEVAGTVYHRAWVSDAVVEHSWTGKAPALFFSGELIYDTGSTDVLCYYLDAGGTNLQLRVQRQNYATEHTVQATLSPALAALTAVDRDGARVKLWGRTTGLKRADVRYVAMASQPYSPWPALGNDAGSAALALLRGDYTSIIAPTPPQGPELIGLSAGLFSGLYRTVAVTQSAGPEMYRFAIALNSGAYTQVITVAPGQLEKLSAGIALTSGNYWQTIDTPATGLDKSTFAVGLLSGVYA